MNILASGKEMSKEYQEVIVQEAVPYAYAIVNDKGEEVVRKMYAQDIVTEMMQHPQWAKYNVKAIGH